MTRVWKCVFCMQITFYSENNFREQAVTWIIRQISCHILSFDVQCFVISLFEPFLRSHIQKFPSELIRWKVVLGIASINILFPEIKALFLWWKCMLRCFFLIFNYFILSSVSSYFRIWTSGCDQKSTVKNMQLLDLQKHSNTLKLNNDSVAWLNVLCYEFCSGLL